MWWWGAAAATGLSLVAAPLPIRVIIAILGVPPEDADYMVELSNHLVEGTTESAVAAA